MAIKKIIVNGTTNIDLSADTTDAQYTLQGYTGHKSDGTTFTGTYVPPSPSLQSKTATPTETAQTITPDSGYDGLSQVDVGAIDSEYVGSDVPRYDNLIVGFIDQEMLGRKQKSLRVSATPGYYEDSPYYSASEATFGSANSVSINSSGDATITFSPATHGVAYEVETYTVTKTGAVTPRASSDLTVSGATVTAPAGYYSSAASKSVASGTEGTPTATKSTVSNHSVTITPSVTNTQGYINGGTKTGTPVTVTAAELVSGSETKTANGTYDVTNLAELIVNVASSGGLVFESGTWTPSSDIARGTINFSNTHTEAPIVVVLSDATGTASSETNSNHAFMYWDYYKAFGVGIPYSSTGFRYAHVTYSYRSNSTSSLSQATTVCSYNSDNTTASGVNYPRYWATNTGFYPYTNSTSRYWRAGRTYKWFAIWKPTT